MIRLRRSSAGLVASLALVVACGPPREEGAEREVELVVLVSIDQFPAYLFERYDSLYTGGLRRLLDEGRVYTQAVHDHAHTWTSVGHATLATGVVPGRHGIVANSWREQIDGQWVRVTSAGDTGETILGVPGKTGISPRNLKAGGLADWILLGDPDSRAVVVSGKTTTSTMLGGLTTSGHVYYFEDDVGRFVTSSYYRDSDPGWVSRFNSEFLPRMLADSVWDCAVPQELWSLARRDDSSYENYGQNVSFPHRFAREVDDDGEPETFNDWWDHTPKLDHAIVAAAAEAVVALGLGQRGHVDYLAVGLSQLDRVGHYWGPISLEQLDAILHLDHQLGEFMDFLDATVGRDNYVLAVTSDHGVVEFAEYRRETGRPGKSVTREELRDLLLAADEAAAAAASPAEAQAAAMEALQAFDFVADVMTVAQLTDGEAADSFVALYQHSQYPGRIPGPVANHGLVLRLSEGTHTGPEPTTHGSVYMYDRHVPLIFMGAGIEAGVEDQPVRTVDIAPTLASLAGIRYPDNLDGRPLIE